MNELVKYNLTEYAHGAGCGCKIAPAVLQEILHSDSKAIPFTHLLVGNDSNDDAAVYQLNNEQALITTTDFFTPIVDDAFLFGRIAAANAISDVYAMGGQPVVAIAILGWPVDVLPISLAQQVIEGARTTCAEADIPLAGGHSIDSKEPIFGLSVNGIASPKKFKRNNTAKAGDYLLLTKPIGVGILSTAQKRKQLNPNHEAEWLQQLTKLNNIGQRLGALDSVTAMTDITGFGLLGHLHEMAIGSLLSAEINYSNIPILESARTYAAQRIIPDATYRNWNNYNKDVQFETGVNVMEAFNMLPDPQTNGGLLIAVDSEGLAEVQMLLAAEGYQQYTTPIGRMVERQEKIVIVKL